VSFDAKPGQSVALVGSTGSGKSTTLGLMFRAHDPQAGRILIEAITSAHATPTMVDVQDCTLSSLRHQIAVVFQEPMLFARSIRDNMLVGKADASDAQIIEALTRAQALELVHASAHGLDTVLGERGRSLSGGERQRLSIARALLKDPPILVLDEATSALDATTEQKLQRALAELMKGRTTLIIAHRLATVRHADQILVFERGHIIERGTFEQLVAVDGTFAQLARAQLLAE
jgi:ATP-binding cassette, subfamily B, beta-glucan exporter